MSNSNNNSNKKKPSQSELDTDVSSLNNSLTDEIKKLDTLSFKQHKQIEQCEAVVKNLGLIFNKLKDTSVHLSDDLDKNSELQTYLFNGLKQLTEDVKTLQSISTDNKAQCDSLSHLNNDLAVFFDGKNKEFRITRDNFNEVINKLTTISTNLTAIQTALDNLPINQEKFLTGKFAATKTSFDDTQKSISSAQTKINEAATNTVTLINGLNFLTNTVAENQKAYNKDWLYLVIFICCVGGLSLFFGIYSYKSNQKIEQLTGYILYLNQQIESIKSSPTPTPTPSNPPNKSDKK